MFGKAAQIVVFSLIGTALSGTARGDFFYGGQAYGAFSPGIVDPPIAATGALPAGGGSLTAHLDSFSFMGLVTSGALDAQIQGAGGLTTAIASVARFHADLRGIGINFFADADLIRSRTDTDGNVIPFSAGGSATFNNLVVNGVAVASAVPANTMVSLGSAGFLVLNEETDFATSTNSQAINNAVHVHLTGGIEIILAHAESTISSQAPVPEPATWMLLGVALMGLVGLRKFTGPKK